MNSKPIHPPLVAHLKLNANQRPSTEKERLYEKHHYQLSKVIHSMVCTRPDLAHVVGMVCRFLTNRGKEQWKVVK